jgi:hypothetical protein
MEAMAAMRARLAVRISVADVGARVTVRARHDGPEAAMADVVGVLRSWDDGVLTIERRDGTLRTVAQDDLVAGRVVPTDPVRRRDRPSPSPQRPRP